MNRKRERKYPLMTLLMLLALVIGLAACGGQDVVQTGTIWDSGRFDERLARLESLLKARK
jgi:ABC-type glycerol-3-phosphate transport system substrate-binding protein